MSSFDRRALLISLAALAGCGFEPVYKTGGTADGLRGAIRVTPPTTRDEYALVSRLEDRLGFGEAARYELRVVLQTDSEGLAITGTNEISRYNLLGTATYLLRDLATNQVVLTDKVNSFTSYSASEQPVATLTAERDAQERLMVALADKITSQLLLNADQL
ncbi:MAG: hypothetical protein JXR14_15335 [Paracoccaceae bacterium]